MEIDWSKAPEGATHYNPHDISTPWRMLGTDGLGWWWNGGTWLPVLGKFAPLTYIAKPSPWAGEGLPPVGTVCEYRVGNGDWWQCTVKYVTRPIDGENTHVVIDCPHLGGEQVSCVGDDYGHVTFRPIRTPEQIAAEQALAEIERLYSEGGPAAVFDAGYRKQA
jgi:hypothetical protein